MHLNQIIATQYGGNYITGRFADVTAPKPKDTRTADEIAADIINRAGLRFA